MRKMLDLLDGPGPDDEFGRPIQNRPDEPGDVLAAILIIGVRVDDDVGTPCDGGLDPGGEGDGKAAMNMKGNQYCPIFPGDFGGPVA